MTGVRLCFSVTALAFLLKKGPDLGQRHRAGGRGPVLGLPGPGDGERGDEMHPSGAALRAGEPGGPPDHARRPRDAARPIVRRLCGTVEAGLRLCVRGDDEL